MALLTDGRFSGGTRGLMIGHVAPEAALGGPIALVEEGDTITIDVDRRALDLEVDEATLAERRSRWQAPEPRYRSGRPGQVRGARELGLEGAVTDRAWSTRSPREAPDQPAPASRFRGRLETAASQRVRLPAESLFCQASTSSEDVAARLAQRADACSDVAESRAVPRLTPASFDEMRCGVLGARRCWRPPRRRHGRR